MTNALPWLSLITIVSTNWVRLPNDLKREAGTNYVHTRLVIQTNVYIQEVSLCTNLTIYKTQSGTNGPLHWEALNPATPPPLPGQFSKP